MESKLKELLATVPVMYLKAVPVQPAWVADSVGYIRNESDTYECPIYQVSGWTMMMVVSGSRVFI